MSKKYYGVDDFLSHMKVKRGRTLVVGSKVFGSEHDRRVLYSDAVGLDMQDGDGVDIVHDFEKPLPEEYGKFDHIDCCSVLEHVQRPWLMAENILKVMKPGATMLIKAPFVWRVHNYPGDYWRFTLQAYEILFPGVEWQERGYLMGNVYKKMTLSQDVDGEKYLHRSEAIAFGLLIS